MTEAAPFDVTRAAGPVPRITRLTSDAMGMIVNLYLVEGAAGVVLIDGAISRTFAARVREVIAATGKPVLGALLTHGHPDHFCGLAEILGPDVPIHALPGAVAQLDARWEEAVPGMRAAFGDDFPATLRRPDVVVRDGDIVRFGDLAFTVRDYGPAESDCDATWTLLTPGGDGAETVFCGDLVYHNMHLFMQDGHAETWLAALARLARTHAPGTRLFPGHGRPGGHELIQWTAGYIRMYLRAMRVALDADPDFGPAVQARLVETIRSFLPNDDLIDLAQFRLDLTARNTAAAARAAKEIY